MTKKRLADKQILCAFIFSIFSIVFASSIGFSRSTQAKSLLCKNTPENNQQQSIKQSIKPIPERNPSDDCSSASTENKPEIENQNREKTKELQWHDRGAPNNRNGAALRG